MRISSVVMLGIAFVCASAAALLVKVWLDNQASANHTPAAASRGPATHTVVVATKALSFGAELTSSNLQEVEWPDKAIPEGTFARKTDLLLPGKKRLVLSAIAANEPISAWKITGPGQRASLSALIGTGMKAVTIRVNDVLGVAGFVLPGDRIDILLTRTKRGDISAPDATAYADLLLQNVRVLAIDQLADHRREKPALAKAVTVEVSTADAQKIALASSIGQLSLALRRADAIDKSDSRRISINDLARDSQLPGPGGENEKRQIIGVTRGLSRTEYSVSPQARPPYRPAGAHRKKAAGRANEENVAERTEAITE